MQERIIFSIEFIHFAKFIVTNLILFKTFQKLIFRSFFFRPQVSRFFIALLELPNSFVCFVFECFLILCKNEQFFQFHLAKFVATNSLLLKTFQKLYQASFIYFLAYFAHFHQNFFIESFYFLFSFRSYSTLVLRTCFLFFHLYHSAAACRHNNG